MKCSHCKAALKPGDTVCPACGKPAQKQNKKMRTWVLALIITVVSFAVLAGSVAIWWAVADVESFGEGIQLILNAFDAPDNNVYYKDSYTVSDNKVQKWADKEIAVVGTETLTNGQFQVYYWMNVYDFLNNYGYYAAYAGLDLAQPLDAQACPETEGSWQHFFLDDALMLWHKYQAMSILARNEGMELTESMQSELDGLRGNMAKAAVDGGYASIDAMLQADMGPGCTFEDYEKYMKTYYMGYCYFEHHYDKIEAGITDQAIEDWFKANEETLKKDGITKDSGLEYDVRHILIAPTGGTEGEDGNMVYSETEWQVCQAEAQKILDKWLAGDKTEDSFAALAKEHSVDTGSASNGGLYQGLDKDTDLVQEFKDWYLDGSRKAGDYGLVKSRYGYHIMYFSGAQEAWINASRQGILTDEADRVASDAMNKHGIRVDYKNIVLGLVDLKKSDGQK